MLPIQTDSTNTLLTLEGAADLPCEQIAVPALSDPARMSVGFESAWQPDAGERRAIANGAPVLLHVWGDHPPVKLLAGEPTEAASALYDEARVMRAFAQLLAVHDPERGWPDDADGMLELVRDALAATVDREAFEARMEALRRRLAP